AVTFEAPAAKAVVDSNALSFAAKRTTSPTNLQKNVRDGRNQLARAAGVGVLFLDITPLATEHGRVHVVPSIEYAAHAFDSSLDNSIRRYIVPIVRWLKAAPQRAKSLVAIVSLLNVRLLVPAVGVERNHFGTLRRLHA